MNIQAPGSLLGGKMDICTSPPMRLEILVDYDGSELGQSTCMKFSQGCIPWVTETAFSFSHRWAFTITCSYISSIPMQYFHTEHSAVNSPLSDSMDLSGKVASTPSLA